MKLRTAMLFVLAGLFLMACITIHITPPAPPSPSPSPAASPSPEPLPSPTGTPGPIPSPAPSPIPPEPSPSPVATPAPPECKTPQLTSDSWEIVNWGGDASQWPPRESFVGFGDPPGVVNQTIMEYTGCGLKAPCPIHGGAQAFHAEIARRLRAKGFCAGQHEDGVSDMIVVSTNPPQDGLWLEVHQVVGDEARGTVQVGWGKIDKATTLWRIKGTGTPAPSPQPSASPTPAPSPKPTADPDAIVSASISPMAVTLKPGQSASFSCVPRNSMGQPVSRAADNVFVGSCMHAGCLGAGDFTKSVGPMSATVRIAPGLKKEGFILVNCAWYGQANTPNAKITVIQ